ncbi:hypothetical protein N657DRAFT_638539 [Parathielavia appendiculata]|uniref:Uncharacterized protein n=1 Tax=Parathielavia appendiculata TaxID=2587402 RepID=A0AAN6U7Y4_9PEZI|nr:hypothetical protein N657DRAFT_638539 [Parathielavia appendiculata]
MEPSAKRARLGPAPFEDFDDPDADELNERPEEVNARRNPAVQLERSRAFAAFKLKSAFERIFEKYEKDFTGVGDEIKLSTGEIVVDNGHIQSLKDAQLGGAEDGDGVSGDEVSDAGSLNEEERMVRGKADNRLSRLGQSPPLLMPPQIGTPPPPFLAAGWSGRALMFGGTPRVPGVIYPGQMPLGGFPMHFATPSPMPTTDPTWKTPELPSSSIRNALTWGESTGSVRKKTARLSLSAAREQNGADEDDIFLDLSATGKDEEKDGESIVKQRVLLPRPPPEKIRVKKHRSKSGGTGPKHAHEVKELRESQHVLKPLAQRKKVFQTKPAIAVDRTGSVPSPEPSFEARADVEAAGNAAERMQADVAEPTTPMVPEGPRIESIERDVPGQSELVVVESPQTTVPKPETEILDPADPDVYARISDEGEEQRLTRKPGNQTLLVEIITGNVLDVHSFRIHTPEPAEADIARHGETVMDGPSPKEMRAAKVRDTDSQSSDRMTASGRKHQPQAVPTEVFARNRVDPTYAFSDEEEPMLPRRRVSQRKHNNSKHVKFTNAGNAVLREISWNVGSGTANGGREPVTDASYLQQVESVAVREQSPTLSLRLDDEESRPGSCRKEPLAGGRDGPRQMLVTKPSQQTADQTGQTPGGHVRSRSSREQAENAPFVNAGPMARGLKAQRNTCNEAQETHSFGSRRRGRPRRTRPRDTPARTSRSLNLPTGTSLAQQIRQEIPETSPNAQPAIRSPETAPMRPILEPIEPKPPFSSAEHTGGTPDQLDRAPSPTPTNPTSQSQPSPFHPEPHKPPLNPGTPVKTPGCRGHKPRQGTAPPTTAIRTKAAKTATTTTTRQGILSLLPAGNDDDDDYKDELSVISPLKPATTVRSTPATHHVRLGLLAPTRSGSDSGRSMTATASKLKNAVLAGCSAAAVGKKDGAAAAGAGPGAGAGLLFRTPSGRKREKEGGPSGAITGEEGSRTPSSSRLELGLLVQTPGGTMRRCGEGGFKCEREFCFSCL